MYIMFEKGSVVIERTIYAFEDESGKMNKKNIHTHTHIHKPPSPRKEKLCK